MTFGEEPSSTWKPDHALLTMSLSSKRPRPCSYTHTPKERSANIRLQMSTGLARERTCTPPLPLLVMSLWRATPRP